MTFTIGKGNELCCAAIQALSELVVGRQLSDLMDHMGAFWRSVTNHSQLRCLGPDKGVIHLATAAELIARALRLHAVCERFAVPLPAAALQFVARHPAVSMMLVGARSVAEIEADIAYVELEIDPALWDALGVADL